MQPKSKRRKHIENHLRDSLPWVPLSDFDKILEIALRGHLRHLPPSIAADQAVTTHVRHNHTDYDDYLANGYDQDSARHFVVNAMQEVIQAWGGKRSMQE